MLGLVILLPGLFALTAGIVRGGRYLAERRRASVPAPVVAIAIPVLGFLALFTILLPFAFVPPFAGLIALVVYGGILWKAITAPLVPGKGGPIGEGLFFGIVFALVLKIVMNNVNL